jgi:hypothetical protein
MITRRQFLSRAPVGVLYGLGLESVLNSIKIQSGSAHEARADLVIVGGGLGGCSAALAALQHGLSVILTDPTDWVGGQLTSQGVPPDEHHWIETHGANASYRRLRTHIRDFYRRHYPLTPSALADPYLNPGKGSVSRLCHEPQVALAVLLAEMAPYLGSRRLQILSEHVPMNAVLDGDQVTSIEVQSQISGNRRWLHGHYFVDASELGDLLPLTRTEHVIGNEGQDQTGELHAPKATDPNNQQAFSCCFAMDYRPGEDHTLSRPDAYQYWRNYSPKLSPEWPGKWFDFMYTHPRSGEPRRLGFNPDEGPHGGVINLWTYRRIAAVNQFVEGHYPSDICLVNWPQNDYLEGPLIGVSSLEREKHIARAKELSLSLLYWLQTEAPRVDGGTGHPGLRLRPDVMGTEDGLAKYPYVRESRRIKAQFTVTEADCGKKQREIDTGLSGSKLRSKRYWDSVGVGSYPIDLHPSTSGENYIDFETLPFEVPLGALIPERVQNLLPANKNIGTTHVTNGCYRLHPVEWGIGEAVGTLVSYCHKKRVLPVEVWENRERVGELQKLLIDRGVEIRWPQG